MNTKRTPSECVAARTGASERDADILSACLADVPSASGCGEDILSSLRIKDSRAGRPRHVGRRGSVLLLAVGLVTMVAMLGATFLIVARMNTRQVNMATVKSYAEPVAGGVLATVCEILRRDLCIGDTGPMGAAYSTRTGAYNRTSDVFTVTTSYGPDSWKCYIDSPDPAIDRHLFSNNSMPFAFKTYAAGTYNSGDIVYESGGGIYYYSMSSNNGVALGAAIPAWNYDNHVAGDIVQWNGIIYQSLTTNANKQPDTSTKDWAPAWSRCATVDTDGDNAPDAYLVPTNVTNGTDRYYAAVKITDNCSKMNLNVATTSIYTGAQTLTNPISPANLEASRLIGNASLAIGLHTNPATTPTAAGVLSFYQACGSRLLNPDTSGAAYRPYSVAEELFLAYYKAGGPQESSPFQNLQYNSVYIRDTLLRQKLTTWSVDRPLPRRPDADLPKWMIQPFAAPCYDATIAYPIGKTVMFCDTTATTGTGKTYYYTAKAATAAGQSPVSAAANWRLSVPSDLNGLPNDPLNNLYQQMLAYLGPVISDTTVREYAAANFTANAFNNADYSNSAAGMAWPFNPTGRTFWAFALPGPSPRYPYGIFLTEAYLKRVTPSGGTAKTVKALEIWFRDAPGPTTSKYFIQFGSGAPLGLTTFYCNAFSGAASQGPKKIANVGTAGSRITLVDTCAGSFTYPDSAVMSAVTGTVYDISANTVANGGNGQTSLDFSQPITLLWQTTINNVVTYVPIDQFICTDYKTAPVSTSPTTDVEWDLAKDDNPTDYRYTVANAMKLSSSGHLLNAVNASATAAASTDISSAAPYPVIWPTARLCTSSTDSMLASLASLSEIYFTGPISYPATNVYYAASARVYDPNFVAAFPVGSTARGRLNLRPPTGDTGSVNSGGWPKTSGGTAGYYPDVPFGCVAGEFFSMLPPDPTRLDEQRFYGRINVNTASREVLKTLPWPITGNTWADTFIQDFGPEFILAYRERRAVNTLAAGQAGAVNTNAAINSFVATLTSNYADRAAATGIANLRSGSAVNAYLTPSEVAIPLADMMSAMVKQNGNNTNPFLPSSGRLTNWPGDNVKTDADLLKYPSSPATAYTTPQLALFPTYSSLRDYLFKCIANCITVRSDAYTANIYVELRDSSGLKSKQAWRYAAVIDRSNCRKASDRPAVLLFTEVK